MTHPGTGHSYGCLCKGCDEIFYSPAIEHEELVQLRSKVERLTKELYVYKKAAPLCDKHQPDNGFRAGCLVCGLISQSAALSRISYLCGEPNEMEVSGYDIVPNEEMVVAQVKNKLDSLKKV